MAEISGEGGGITFSSGETSVHSWTLSYAGDALETTDFSDSSGGRSYIAGITNWSGSYDCYFDPANVVIPSGVGTLTLTVSTGTTTKFKWSGSVVITGMDISVPVDGIITQSYTFQGNGALTSSTS